MKKRILALLLVSFLLLTTVSLASASDMQPQGGCPGPFVLHMAMDHEHPGEGQHLHVGNDSDLNGDGYICGKHVGTGGNVHVHIDNNVPLP